MLLRIMRIFAPAIICLTLVAGPAKAVTLLIEPTSSPGTGSFQTLLGGTDYAGGHTVSGSGADYYNFHVPFVPVGTTTVEIPAFGTITNLQLAWLDSSLTVQASNPGALLVYAITTAGDWFLRVSGTTLNGPANYTVTVTATPLPPALILFGTALVGMTLLGRRRRSARPPAM
jgi:hypothetical protein